MKDEFYAGVGTGLILSIIIQIIGLLILGLHYGV